MTDETHIRDLVAMLLKYERAESCPAMVLTGESVRRVERELAFELPAAYWQFVRALDGIVLPNWELYRSVPKGAPDLDRFDIVGHNRWLRDARGVPADLIAFYSDGLGDECCFDTAARHEGWPIFRWVHDAPEDDCLEPEARSFLEWIERAIAALPDIHR